MWPQSRMHITSDTMPEDHPDIGPMGLEIPLTVFFSFFLIFYFILTFFHFWYLNFFHRANVMITWDSCFRSIRWRGKRECWYRIELRMGWCDSSSFWWYNVACSLPDSQKLFVGDFFIFLYPLLHESSTNGNKVSEKGSVKFDDSLVWVFYHGTRPTEKFDSFLEWRHLNLLFLFFLPASIL